MLLLPPPSMPPPAHRTEIILLEDNDAVVKACMKGRSLNFRHCGRTHRIDLDWLFERILTDKSIHIQFISTKLQIAEFNRVLADVIISRFQE